MSKFHLVCVHPNGSYAKGQMITDQEEVGRIMGANLDGYFVRTPAPPEPEAPPPIPQE
jgi:hypothetical protein